MDKKRLSFPKGYKITKKSFGPSFGDGHNLLRDYCNSCLKDKKCKMTKLLRHAMGENFPFWAKSFLFIEVPTDYKYFNDTETRVMCRDYKSEQQKLKLKIKSHDGVDRLLELAENEKKKYLEENPPEEDSLESTLLETGTIDNIN